MVLVNPPQSPAVTVTLPGTHKRVDGTQVNSLTLQASQGAVLLSTSTPPVVSLSLANSASVSGTTNVTATVSNSVSVTSVGFYVDNSLVFTSTASPYAFAWNTASYANGSDRKSTRLNSSHANI